jgi:hypothetical protein
MYEVAVWCCVLGFVQSVLPGVVCGVSHTQLVAGRLRGRVSECWC